MHFIISVVSVLGVLLIGVISPGPSFVLVAQTSVGASRRAGIAAALGMGVGATSLAALAILGLHALLASVPWLFVLFKTCSGVYLIYLAIRIWKAASKPLTIAPLAMNASQSRHFFMALGTMLTNPKAAVQYGIIFAALLPHEVPLILILTLLPLIFLLEAGWYTTVALILSSVVPRRAYLKCKKWIDRFAGGVLGLLGLKLIASTS
ncbi:LysE family transporter [Herbaspirillum sp. RTI4]|uniref:LysE family translocator n=1 Tax=Herbaspirillum sp. RTI4 TaxID=3048640 RepID=UPI002AB4D1E8|nr:LysE family transporter [Herbaspirillum sp. RTI4]MDY7577648.1 LysE family transporter [Herbaspirillum sp. RTI4]MEA9982186.1 LysE family transporter [Herbaspirillum sp. RTI4]